MKALKLLVAFSVLMLSSVPVVAQDQHSGQHDQHHSGVNERGDHAMGFSHEKTAHHFRLRKDGGIIEVTAKDAKDEQSREQIRMHLQHITRLFSEGDFTAPMFIHDRVPPGVPTMKELKAEITYRFENLENGGRVLIESKNSRAIDAIHEFLRFQIEDHRTGDSTEVESN
jgi:hypothetical protein